MTIIVFIKSNDFWQAYYFYIIMLDNYTILIQNFHNLYNLYKKNTI